MPWNGTDNVYPDTSFSVQATGFNTEWNLKWNRDWTGIGRGGLITWMYCNDCHVLLIRQWGSGEDRGYSYRTEKLQKYDSVIPLTSRLPVASVLNGFQLVQAKMTWKGFAPESTRSFVQLRSCVHYYIGALLYVPGFFTMQCEPLDLVTKGLVIW